MAGRKDIRKAVGLMLEGGSVEQISQHIHRTMMKKARKVVERQKIKHGEFPTEFVQEEYETTEEEFSDPTNHSDLDREINENIDQDLLTERSGGLHYNAMPKIHRTLIDSGFRHVQSSGGAARLHHYHNPISGSHVVASWAGYKLRRPSGQVVSGRHHKHLQKHLHQSSLKTIHTSK